MSETFSETDLEEYLTEAILEYASACGEPEPTINTFREAGLMTTNKGLVLRFAAGAFQITIVRTR